VCSDNYRQGPQDDMLRDSKLAMWGGGPWNSQKVTLCLQLFFKQRDFTPVDALYGMLEWNILLQRCDP
jgi:hypothetical protein